VAIVELRQRSGFLFLAVMLGHILLISAQVSSRSGVPVLEAVTFGVFAEVQRGVSTGVRSVRQVWSGYLGLRHVKQENDQLKRELAAARVEVQQQRALADRSLGLEKLLAMRDRLDLKTVAAEIIAAGATPDFRTLTIGKGTNDGLQRDMAVISPMGVVGRIVVPSARAAKVQLLIDRNAAAGALIERSRAQGVIVGAGDNRLTMEYVSEVSDVVPGDVVVTSGIDGIYPKGFVIGEVETVEKHTGGKHIVVKPAADPSLLEEVLVVVTPSPAREADPKPSPAREPAPKGTP
jgi:rod shape-determining protein MreC